MHTNIYNCDINRSYFVFCISMTPIFFNYDHILYLSRNLIILKGKKQEKLNLFLR